jgi:DNA-binding transcriptional LysR family regulator
MATDSPIRFNLRQLGVFRSVAESGGIRAAARRLGLTQPAVTHAVRELEQGLGVDLFVRSAKGVRLTAPGEALLLRTQRILHEAQSAQAELEQMGGGLGGRLRIALSAAASSVLPQALSDFRAQRPDVVLELREMTWPTRLDGWREGEYDFAVLAQADVPHVPHQDALEREPLFAIPAVLAVRTGHPLAGARSIAELAQALWLAPGYGMEVLDLLFAQCQTPPPRDIIYCHSVSIALSLLRATDAVGVVSSRLFLDAGASRGLVALAVAEPLPAARVCVVIRDRQALTPAARLFIDCLHQAAKAL